MKDNNFFQAILLLISCIAISSCKVNETQTTNAQYVNKFIGTAGNGRVSPVTSTPFGMIQIAPDTYRCNSGYQYEHDSILGFSHVHKSGGGCGDFLDILFMPLETGIDFSQIELLPTGKYSAPLDHNVETSTPGYYSVELYNGKIKAELTASEHCAVQRYTYSEEGTHSFLIDLEHGATGACTIEQEKDTDLVFDAVIEQVDDYTIRGYRLSRGWAPEQHVYFYAVFSSPINNCQFFSDNKLVLGTESISGKNLKVLLTFKGDDSVLEVKSAISAVDMEGAENNLKKEVAKKTFQTVFENTRQKWNDVLGKIEIKTSSAKYREIFYTSLYNTLLYPMLYSDVDNRFRGPDRQIHTTDGFPYYAGVVGLWDTFRAACPLLSAFYPDVMKSYVNTMLEHYKYSGQLPIWTLAGVETFQMIGLHAMPVITNAYLNGILFDTDKAMEAMVTSAMKDTCGFSMGYFVGLENYKKYGYVPCDLEMESVARTLEYAYDDWAIARFASLTGDKENARIFSERSQNYRNLFDAESGYMRGKDKNGQWRTPFDPLRSGHRTDDYCEGNAWQWTFFVPHDVDGLAEIMGGKDALRLRLDSLFTITDQITGDNISGDISGLIGQYAQGNEPGHHTIYMFNQVGEPRKAQYYAHKVLTTLYDNTPDGICGNEDTGQMSAWYVFSSMGLYPLDPVSGRYEFGSPIMEEVTMHLPTGNTFSITTDNLSEENIYIKSAYLNNKKLNRTYITFEELNQGGTLRFNMTN